MLKKILISSALSALIASNLAAGDVRIGGFINVVGGMNDLDSGSYLGYDDQYDFTNESLAAIQFSGDITEKMGATIQLVAQKDALGDDIRMEWGYVSYDVNDEIRILAGRIRPALFLYSDYLDVGYAYTWITPPDEVYFQAQITNLDGGSVTYNMDLDGNSLALNVYAGNTNTDKATPAGDVITLNNDSIIGAELAYINDYGKIRIGYTSATLNADNATIFPDGTPDPVVSALGFDDSSAAFYGAGVNLDYEDMLLSAEYIVRDMDETSGSDVSSYYVMLGYKIGDFTPNYTYAQADSDIDLSTTGNAQVDGMINGARYANLDDRSSHTIGLRYDLNIKAALKVEYNAATLTHSNYANGTMTEVDEDVSTYRVALNIVF